MAVAATTVPAGDNATRFAPLFAFLAEMNGMDFYDAKNVALGRLSNNHYLMLPPSFSKTVVDTAIIGSTSARGNISNETCAEIYALNKSAFEGEEVKIKASFLRLQLVLAGWVSGDYEVKIVDPPVDSLDIMNTDMPKLRELAIPCRTLAQILPIAAEHMFRVTGHHYLTVNAAEYNAKYSRYFGACGIPDLVTFLPPEILFHRVAHWVSLELASRVVMDPRQVVSLPNACIMRARASPAGTAIIATSCAILDAMDTVGLKAEMRVLSEGKVEALDRALNTISEDPIAYHTTAVAYGRPALTPDRLASLEVAKKAGAALAPILQGFLDALPRGADLAQARALEKHANGNPIIRKKAKTLFQEMGKTKAIDLTELFRMKRRANEVRAEGGVMDDLDQVDSV